jgi:uncharacterized protein (TIGR00730 family)
MGVPEVVEMRICVFCGSSTGSDPRHIEAARALGRAMAGSGVGLVYGGGSIGLMGALADAVLRFGGEAIGVIPGFLNELEVGHRGLTDLRVVSSMHERKALMAQLCDAFVALPGGFGTLEEFSEVLTWAQLGLHAKPCALLNATGFFDPLLALFDRQVAEGFLSSKNRELVLVERDPDALVERLRALPVKSAVSLGEM